ncbi:MAG: PBSX family phage terminase large subunit [Ruminiclostridium sp.]
MSDVRISELIAPSFFDLHRSIKGGKITHYWMRGGRGSCKSSFTSIEIILGIMKNPDANAVVIRKVGTVLRDSVYEQLVWAINKLGVSEFWKLKLTPLEMIYIPTGQRILFRGADKPRKLKSTKVSNGYIRYVWYEEADEFFGQEEIDSINQSLLRGGSKYDVFYTFNPPKSVRNWVNAEMLVPRSDKAIHSSDYLSVPRDWLGEQFFIEAEHLKKTNLLRYRNEYLGEITGTGAEVFANLSVREISKEELGSFDRIYRGIDWGYGADPFAYIVMHYDSRKKVLYIFHEYYKCGAKFDEITRHIKQENKSNSLINAESAEPRSNDELRDRGLRIQKVNKGSGSVEHGIVWLQNLEQIVIDPVRCPNTAREFSRYELLPDGNGGYRDGYPDKDNHTIDAVRYALEQVIGNKKPRTAKKSLLGIY